MQGQSEALTSTEIVPDSYEYRYLTNKIIPLKNPVGEDITYNKTQGYRFDNETNQQEWLDSHVTGSSCYGYTNLVPEFCRAYTKISGKQVLAVHIAKGSTVIGDWIPGTAGYQIIVEKSLAAITSVKSKEDVNSIYFIWLQGESDAICGNSKEYYKEKITELNEALKKDVGIKKFGIVRVGHFTNDERDSEIISAQDEICNEKDDFIMLTNIATKLNEQSEYMNPYVSGHYSAKGLEKLGVKIILKALEEPARQIATKRMVDEATALGADAVINIRYESASLMQGAAEVIAYGTAAKFVNK